MRMPVVCVREMRMGVRQRFMPVRMTMSGTGRDLGIMRMLMMFIVNVLVIVRGLLMEVLMFMALGQMQPHTECHQRPGDKKR